MNMLGSTTSRILFCLQRQNFGDQATKNELLAFAQCRLRELAGRMFARAPLLHPIEQADDLFQEAMIRISNSLDDVRPGTMPEFMGLAALQIRRALCDLIRSHFGRNYGEGVARPFKVIPSTGLGDHVDALSNEPEILTIWAQFHDAASQLVDRERTAFDLLYYGDLPPIEVAELMGVCERQVRRYWQSARRKIARRMEDFWPDVGDK